MTYDDYNGEIWEAIARIERHHARLEVGPVTHNSAAAGRLASDIETLAAAVAHLTIQVSDLMARLPTDTEPTAQEV